MKTSRGIVASVIPPVIEPKKKAAVNQLIVCLTKDDTGDREDCNVFYSDYYLITSDTLTFSESLFDDKLEVHKKSRLSWLTAVRALGYTVHDIEQRVIVLSRV